jgi:FkbM family methyltransferase
MYSQNNEEELILEKFSTYGGKFLDIGAYDGKKFSNTFALLERGWSGVMVEPSPCVFVKLMENTKEFKDRVSLVNCAVSIKSEILLFHDSGGDALSTSDEAHREKWEKGSSVSFRKMFVKTITIKEILDLFGYDFSFINIDVEGQNYKLYEEIKELIRFGKLPQLKMICIEHDGQHLSMQKEMKFFGFEKVLLNGENIIFWKG